MRKHLGWNKKVISVLVVLCMFFTMTSTAVAESDMSASADNALDQKVKEAQKYAYMDIDKVSPDMKEKVLEARDTIIYSEGWVADGFEGYVEHADGTIEKLPLFSELFPGWDLPCSETDLDNENIQYPMSSLTKIDPFSSGSEDLNEFYSNISLEDCELIPESVQVVQHGDYYSMDNDGNGTVVIDKNFDFDESGMHICGFTSDDDGNTIITVVKKYNNGIMKGMRYRY